MKTQPLTKARARQLLEQSREDIAHLLTVRYETDREINRLIIVNDELYMGILGEEAPPLEIEAKAG